MAIVKTSVVLQSEGDIDALLAKRGATVKTKIGQRGYELDGSVGALVMVSWDSTLGATPTQGEVNALTAGDRTAGTLAVKVAALKVTSRTLDRLADFAAMRMAANLTEWNKLTTLQKVAAVTSDADAWLTVRQLIESNVP